MTAIQSVQQVAASTRRSSTLNIAVASYIVAIEQSVLRVECFIPRCRVWLSFILKFHFFLNIVHTNDGFYYTTCYDALVDFVLALAMANINIRREEFEIYPNLWCKRHKQSGNTCSSV